MRRPITANVTVRTRPSLTLAALRARTSAASTAPAYRGGRSTQAPKVAARVA